MRALLFAFFLTAISGSAFSAEKGCSYCFFEANLRTSPQPPTANTPFLLLADFGGCYEFLNAEPVSVVQEGSTIRVTVLMTGAFSCGIALGTREWTVGPLPAGNYSLELYGIDSNFPSSDPVLVEGIQVSLAGFPSSSLPNQIPSSGTLTLAILVAILALVGLLRFPVARA